MSMITQMMTIISLRIKLMITKILWLSTLMNKTSSKSPTVKTKKVMILF